MRDSQPLLAETVIFTGTPKSTDVFELVKRYGGTPVSLPLIQVAELVEPTDELRLNACPIYDWLIFTSQSAVAAFGAKLIRHGFSSELIPAKIAAVGTRTAEALEKIGFTVDFIPTVFSADTFVKEFNPADTDIRRILFLRGSIAGVTIKEELPFEVDEWTIYTTERAGDSIDSLVDLLQQKQYLTVLFASPSAVDVFAEEVVPRTGWTGFTIGAIGHVTEKALLEAGAAVHVRPDTYTLMDLVEKLAGRKEG
ncbi:uroporphyrinogen-III synthase [Sporosarcina sp. ANT_H38]|uniref:uroporphyrinogen-III synthase n=1 Tax=Sporosarcina sp. ANT_H38 TaxID=2597358 RepID=UPI0011F3E6BF|nr:uroporphyrinogen-III synthase [Sporosarcina sp. ANT_H38]KAA0965329.1 uroporphyrinogen-III synthase [Sporosarcina sp. ANT_H38]